MKKKVFQNGTLKSKAYFMNGDVKQEVEEAVWEGTTPLSAENINEMQDNIEEEIDSHIERRYSVTLAADVAKGGTITIPAYYKVRSRHIRYILHGRKTAIKQRRCRHRRTLSRNRHS